MSTRATAFLGTLVLLVCCSGFVLADDINDPGFQHSSNPTPFDISSTCPPASCPWQWSGLDDPFYGNTDFGSAGIPVAFDFTTGNPLSWYCTDESCSANYGYGGSFELTTPGGTFTGVITSGTAYQGGQGFDLVFNFFGKWDSGQYMSGRAEDYYTEEAQIPVTHLSMVASPEPGSFLLLGSGLLGTFGFRRLLHAIVQF